MKYKMPDKYDFRKHDLRKDAMDAEAAQDFLKGDPGGFREFVNYKMVVMEGHDPGTIGEIMVRLSPTLWRSYNYLDTFPAKCWHDCWDVRPVAPFESVCRKSAARTDADKQMPPHSSEFWIYESRECGYGKGTNVYVTDVLSFFDPRDAERSDSPVGWLIERIWEKKKRYKVGPQRQKKAGDTDGRESRSWNAPRPTA